MRAVVPLFALSLIAACNSRGPAERPRAGAKADPASAAPEPRRAAPAARWQGQTLSLDGFPSWKLKLPCCTGDPRKIRVTYENFAEGTHFAVGKARWTRQRGYHVQYAEVDVVPYLGGLDLTGYVDPRHRATPLDLSLPIEIQIPGPWEATRTEAPPAQVAHHQATMALRTIVEGPIRFADEPAKPRPDTAFLIDPYFPPPRPLLGPGRRLADVDWVGITTWKPTGKTRRCGGYSNTPGVRGSTVVTLGLNEVELVVYDRRTGARLGARTFPPGSACPKFASGTSIGVGASQDDIRAWLDQQLTRGRLPG